MQNKTLLFQLEQDLANLILTKLEHLDITFERASQIAKFILIQLPENLTDEEVLKIIPTLDDEFTELAEIVYKYMTSYEEKYQDAVTKKAEELIKHKHFEEANNLIQKYYNEKFTQK